MNKEELKKLVNQAGMIPGIFNYCDRWCERCSYTSRCSNYAISEQHFSKSDGNFENETFWNELREIFQLTIEMIRESMEEYGIDLDPLEFEKYDDS